MVKKEIPIMQTVRMCDFCEDTYTVGTCDICGKDLCADHNSELELTWKHTITLCPDCKKIDFSKVKKISKKITAAYCKIYEYEKEIEKLLEEAKVNKVNSE